MEKQKHDNRAKELTAAASSPASTTGSTSAAGPLPFRGARSQQQVTCMCDAYMFHNVSGAQQVHLMQ